MKDPYRTLGVPVVADDAAIHAAYLEQIRANPPERDPERFQEVRRAYDRIKTRRLRLQFALFHADPPTLDDILEHALAPAKRQRPSAEVLRRCLAAGLSHQAATKRDNDADA